MITRKRQLLQCFEEKIFPAPERKNTIAISLVKNASRFEWFLEKATENGIAAIIPLICSRTEKQHFRTDRMKNILISAMLQSQQVWLPEMHEPQSFLTYISTETASQKFIAHCEPDKEKIALSKIYKHGLPTSILIGPEGDFTAAEIKSALDAGFVPVALGETRLRTETAGLAAAVLLQQL
ncbi:MAG: RsmE family RNA methyltransferase [Ferruginibacter sp.]